MYDAEPNSGTLDRVSDLGSTPAAEVKRWVLELKLADKSEKNWRKDAQRVWDRYRGQTNKRNTFNILWSNTETLRPAIYNASPKPDVRRRFKDKDPLGKVASEVVCRCLEYAIDTTYFDDVIKASVLDMLLPGRAVTRVRYVPSFSQVGTPEGHVEESEDHAHESQEGSQEELAWEQVDIEQVQWDDFRRGPGKSWDEVRWVGFRHRMTRDDLVKLNPEIGEQIELDSADDEDVKKSDQAVADIFKTCEVWEIWCKESRKVYFIAENYKAEPVKTEEDPLNLLGFFPIPRPLQAVEDSSNLVPTTLFSLYEEQANELDTITARIQRLVKGLKMRGVYDATIAELSQVMRGDDNDLIPAQNVSALLDRGGLEKAIWFLPIEQSAKVLAQLYTQREQVKQTIYEITGISDILRGSSVASETATAQNIKSQWGTLRIQRMQIEVQRYIRDLFRLMSEIIGEKFTPQTLIAQSLLPQEAVMQAIPVLQSDMLREFRIDVETDSTVSAGQQSDMKGMQEVLTGVVQFVQGIGPAVQAKAIPIEAVKEVLMAIIRRAKLGNAVEDAFEGIQDPQQSQGLDPQQVQQAKQQYEQKIQQLTQQLQQAQGQLQQVQQSQQLEGAKLQQSAQLEQAKLQTTLQKAQMEIEAQKQIEEMKAQVTLKTKAMDINASNPECMTELDEEGTEKPASALSELVESLNMNMNALMENQAMSNQATMEALAQTQALTVEAINQAMNRPRKVVRGSDGRIAGVA